MGDIIRGSDKKSVTMLHYIIVLTKTGATITIITSSSSPIYNKAISKDVFNN